MSPNRVRNPTNDLTECESQEITFNRIEEIHSWMQSIDQHILTLPEIREMLMTISKAQATMADSAKSMADTFRMAEDRYQRLEELHKKLTELAVGKDQIPLRSHYSTLAVAFIPTIVMAIGMVIGVLYVAKYDITASLTSIQMSQSKTQELIKDASERVLEKEASDSH